MSGKKNNKVVGTIQARMGSSRLPGKVMRNVCGKPLLGWQISRIKQNKREIEKGREQIKEWDIEIEDLNMEISKLRIELKEVYADIKHLLPYSYMLE
mgnify:CR=1 FL=1